MEPLSVRITAVTLLALPMPAGAQLANVPPQAACQTPLVPNGQQGVTAVIVTGSGISSLERRTS